MVQITFNGVKICCNAGDDVLSIYYPSAAFFHACTLPERTMQYAQLSLLYLLSMHWWKSRKIRYNSIS